MLRWDDSYSVHVQKLDFQHKQLFDAINRFEEAVDAGEGPPAFVKLLDFLISYSKFHFDTEEKYFESFGFELAEAHKAQHQAYMDIVRRYKERFETDDLIVPAEVTGFLNNWINEHVLSSDQRYVDCFLRHGLS